VEPAKVGGVIEFVTVAGAKRKMADDEQHRTATEARGASKQGVVRYVLAISLALVILAYIVILLV
jgi:hypothetical protein